MVRGISLGKSDVRNKAYDRMFEVARAFPGGVDFYVIPHNQRAWKEEFEALVAAQTRDDKIRIHGGVHGAEKAAAFARASVCLHLARWEVFGMAIVEAAMHGLALVLSSECDIAPEAESAGAAYVMYSYDAAAIDQLEKWLRDGPELQLTAERARHWANSQYSAPAVAAKVLQFYQLCLA
jgi:glycosyltransferase involved in cell wall biosynthesis